MNVELDCGSALTTYSISNLGVTTPGDWTSTLTQPLTYQGIVAGQYVYTGKIAFAAGTPVGDGDDLDFHYRLTFAGSTSYHVIQEITPVPEPSTFVLLGLGAIGLFYGILRRRAA